MMLWGCLINQPNLSGAVFFLNFTRADVFRRKISSGISDLSTYFPKYTGGPADVEAGQRFFANKFRSLQRSPRSVHVSFIDATDRDQVEVLLEEVTRRVRIAKDEIYRV